MGAGAEELNRQDAKNAKMNLQLKVISCALLIRRILLGALGVLAVYFSAVLKHRYGRKRIRHSINARAYARDFLHRTDCCLPVLY